MEAVGGGGDVLVSNNCFFYNKTQQHHFWNFILMTQCKLCTRAAATAVAVNREVADEADDAFFTDKCCITAKVPRPFRTDSVE